MMAKKLENKFFSGTETMEKNKLRSIVTMFYVLLALLCTSTISKCFAQFFLRCKWFFLPQSHPWSRPTRHVRPPTRSLVVVPIARPTPQRASANRAAPRALLPRRRLWDPARAAGTRPRRQSRTQVHRERLAHRGARENSRLGRFARVEGPETAHGGGGTEPAVAAAPEPVGDGDAGRELQRRHISAHRLVPAAVPRGPDAEGHVRSKYASAPAAAFAATYVIEIENFIVS